MSSLSPVSDRPTADSADNPQLARLLKSYQAPQQLKYLHLQAEVEVLLQQLQTMKRQQQGLSPSEMCTQN